MPFRILYVCTGNVCRSPVAELLTREATDPATELVVLSAGTRALVGQPIDAASAEVLERLGVDPRPHQARQLEPWMVTKGDLVLTASRKHRDFVIGAQPTAHKRAFTMKEFARLAAAAAAEPPPEPVAVVAAAAAMRGQVPPVPSAEDDIPDPYGRGAERADAVAREIVGSVGAALSALGYSLDI